LIVRLLLPFPASRVLALGNLNLKQTLLIAYQHEAGHAVVDVLVPNYDQVQKITIIPRLNGAGSLTFFAPQEYHLESGMYSKLYVDSHSWQLPLVVILLKKSFMEKPR
jgi:hypothetical protein